MAVWAQSLATEIENIKNVEVNETKGGINMKKYNMSKLVIVLLWVIAAFLSFNFGLYEIEKASKPLCNIVIGVICLYAGKEFVGIAKDIWENCK